MPQLDGMRALAVASVLVQHWFATIIPIGSWGGAAVLCDQRISDQPFAVYLARWGRRPGDRRQAVLLSPRASALAGVSSPDRIRFAVDTRNSGLVALVRGLRFKRTDRPRRM